MGKKKLLTFRKTRPGHLKCSLNLSELYRYKNEREKSDSNWDHFLDSDPYNKEAYQQTDDELIFDREQLIPSKKDNRPPLLLVFGNPAYLKDFVAFTEMPPVPEGIGYASHL